MTLEQLKNVVDKYNQNDRELVLNFNEPSYDDCFEFKITDNKNKILTFIHAVSEELIQKWTEEEFENKVIKELEKNLRERKN